MTEQTQQKSSVPMAEDACIATGSVQWLLGTQEDKNVETYHANELEALICGENAFRKIAEDIENAQHSIDIVCWGFDPAMELTRDKNHEWPRGATWGQLLEDAAAGRGKSERPVKVRILSWYGFIGSSLLGGNNMPGHSHDSLTSAQRDSRANPGHPAPHSGTGPKDARRNFNAQWYQDAFGGKLSNLFVRTRNGDRDAVKESLASEPGKRGWLETKAMEWVATDHQKTILIDYEHEGGAHAVGYVMGLNSVTDYWDTEEHLFNDPRRGESWEGANDTQPGLKPYRDYACRIRGAALVAVSKNFTEAWNRAEGRGDAVTRNDDLKSPPKGLTQQLANPSRQRAQVVRTLPEDKDKSVKRLYLQASSFARHYLYLENQYFQYTLWAEELKRQRQAYCDAWARGCQSGAPPPELHAFIVIPLPEKGFMVPRTHDTVKSLGHGTSVPEQEKAIEKGDIDGDIATDSKALGSTKSIQANLDAMGLRTLVASLWTFNKDWQSTEKKQREKLQALEGLPAEEARLKAEKDKLLAERYREIYIHSKLMVIDDSMYTLGSANLNTRSMAVDAEINVATDNPEAAEKLRRDVWGGLTGGAADCNPETLDEESIRNAFEKWNKLMNANADEKKIGNLITGFLVPFKDERTSRIRLG